jgi:urease beta subunit
VAVTVHYVTADGTATYAATAGSDYAFKSGDVTIPAGQLSAVITVAVIGDRVIEPFNEHFEVNLSNATNATIADGAGLGTILDDEPQISIGNTTVKEGHSGTVNATFTVSLSKASTEDVTVHYQTADGAATAGSDYVATSADVTIPAGRLSATITVPVIGDLAVEAAEDFQVYLSSPTNATIADGWASGTILDDELRISIGDVTRSEGKKGKTTLFTFTVTLSVASDQPVTMSYRTADGTATTAGSDYVAKTGTLTFAPGETTKTITIEVKGDRNKEVSETFYLDLFGLSSNASFTKNRGIGTILNDD